MQNTFRFAIVYLIATAVIPGTGKIAAIQPCKSRERENFVSNATNEFLTFAITLLYYTLGTELPSYIVIRNKVVDKKRNWGKTSCNSNV